MDPGALGHEEDAGRQHAKLSFTDGLNRALLREAISDKTSTLNPGSRLWKLHEPLVPNVIDPFSVSRLIRSHGFAAD